MSFLKGHQNIFIIDEEDLDLNEIPVNEVEDNILGKRIDYIGNYLGMKIIFRIFDDSKLLDLELEIRQSHQIKFLSSLYGFCNHSEFGQGLILSFVGENSLIELTNEDSSLKKEIVIDLTHLYYYFNCRKLKLSGLTLDAFSMNGNSLVIQDLREILIPYSYDKNRNKDTDEIIKYKSSTNTVKAKISSQDIKAEVEIENTENGNTLDHEHESDYNLPKLNPLLSYYLKIYKKVIIKSNIHIEAISELINSIYCKENKINSHHKEKEINKDYTSNCNNTSIDEYISVIEKTRKIIYLLAPEIEDYFDNINKYAQKFNISFSTNDNNNLISHIILKNNTHFLDISDSNKEKLIRHLNKEFEKIDFVALESWNLGLLIYNIIEGRPLSSYVSSPNDSKAILKCINALQITIQLKNFLKKLLKSSPESRLQPKQYLSIINSLKDDLETTFNFTEIKVNNISQLNLNNNANKQAGILTSMTNKPSNSRIDNINRVYNKVTQINQIISSNNKQRSIVEATNKGNNEFLETTNALNTTLSIIFNEPSMINQEVSLKNKYNNNINDNTYDEQEKNLLLKEKTMNKSIINSSEINNEKYEISNTSNANTYADNHYSKQLNREDYIKQVNQEEKMNHSSRLTFNKQINEDNDNNSKIESTLYKANLNKLENDEISLTNGMKKLNMNSNTSKNEHYTDNRYYLNLENNSQQIHCNEVKGKFNLDDKQTNESDKSKRIKIQNSIKSDKKVFRNISSEEENTNCILTNDIFSKDMDKQSKYTVFNNCDNDNDINNNNNNKNTSSLYMFNNKRKCSKSNTISIIESNNYNNYNRVVNINKLSSKDSNKDKDILINDMKEKKESTFYNFIENKQKSNEKINENFNRQSTNPFDEDNFEYNINNVPSFQQTVENSSYLNNAKIKFENENELDYYKALTHRNKETNVFQFFDFDKQKEIKKRKYTYNIDTSNISKLLFDETCLESRIDRKGKTNNSTIICESFLKMFNENNEEANLINIFKSQTKPSLDNKQAIDEIENKLEKELKEESEINSILEANIDSYPNVNFKEEENKENKDKLLETSKEQTDKLNEFMNMISASSSSSNSINLINVDNNDNNNNNNENNNNKGEKDKISCSLVKKEYNIFEIFKNSDSEVNENKANTNNNNNLNSNLLIEKEKNINDLETLNNIFNSEQEKNESLYNIQIIKQLEMVSLQYKKKLEVIFLTDIEHLVLQLDLDKLTPEIMSSFTQILWNSLMCLAFKLLDSDSIKSHYLTSFILFKSLSFLYPSDNLKSAYCFFHYGIAVKEFFSDFKSSQNLLEESIRLLTVSGQLKTKIGIQAKYYLGSLFDDLGLSERSFETLNEVLKLQKSSYENEETPVIAKTFNLLGICEDNRKNFKVAMDYYKKAYTIFKNCSEGVENTDCAKSLNNIAGIYYNWEEYKKCCSIYQQVLKIYLNYYGKINIYTAMAYNNLGNTVSCLNSFNDAESYFKKALEIYNQVLGENNIQTAMVRKNLGDLYYYLGKSDLAKDMFDLCLNVFKEKYGDDSDIYLAIKAKLIKLRFR